MSHGSDTLLINASLCAVVQERRDLVASVRSTLLSEGFSPDVPHYRLPSLLQRMLKTQPMAYRTVEYR
jgi:hypothetical protein